MESSDLEVKFIDRNHCDVFFGKGWENWTRFEIKRIKGKVFPIKLQGAPLPSETFKELCKNLI